MRKPEITKKTRTPSSPSSNTRPAASGMKKPRVPTRWLMMTSKIDKARRPSRDLIRSVSRLIGVTSLTSPPGGRHAIGRRYPRLEHAGFIADACHFLVNELLVELFDAL